MIKKLKCIMLVDDNPADNFFHKRIIQKCEAAENILIKETAIEALAYLKSGENKGIGNPTVILLDINMPAMDGWEFLEEYKKLSAEQQSSIIVIMLTTSNNPDDKEKAEKSGVPFDFLTKPLTPEMLERITNKVPDSYSVNNL